MIKQNIKFLTTGQFLTFSHTCINLSSDVRIQDLENHNRVDINGKDLSELATIQLGLPFLLVIHGEDEILARRMLKKYCAKKLSCSFQSVLAATQLLLLSPDFFCNFFHKL